MNGLRAFLRDVWRLSRPYFATSEERWSARGLLAVVIAMNLAIVGINVVLSFWNREFFNALQDKDQDAFINLLFTWHRTSSGLMPGFVSLVATYILVAIYRTYLQQALQIRWRRWMTARLLDDWFAGRAYYRIGLATDSAATGTDNPDQRISEDVRDFTDNALTLGLSFISNIVSLVSFLGILWSLSGAFTLFGVTIPGYMVWVAVIYAVIGTTLTHLIGRPLVRLNFRQQRVEADFRYALVRVRENMEGIALHSGEDDEKAGLRGRFAKVIDNFRAIMQRTKRLNALIYGYNQLANIFPFVVAAPRYFAGALTLGGLTQTADAFGRVQESLSWFVTSYTTLATWRSIVDRLTTFADAIEAAHANAASGPRMAEAQALALDHLSLQLPDGAALLDRASRVFPPGRDVLISGRSGSGKSTLFRAIAGLWPFGSGTVERPAGKKMFLPQRAYIPLGTLRHAITYPSAPSEHDDAAVRAALHEVGLGAFASRLDTDENWPQLLSGGEQQRVAIARALLSRPDWLFLDEATASLDPESEQALYALLRARLPDTTIVSIAHRESLARFHDDRLVFSRTPGRPGTLVAADAANPQPALTP